MPLSYQAASSTMSPLEVSYEGELIDRMDEKKSSRRIWLSLTVFLLLTGAFVAWRGDVDVMGTRSGSKPQLKVAVGASVQQGNTPSSGPPQVSTGTGVFTGSYNVLTKIRSYKNITYATAGMRFGPSTLKEDASSTQHDARSFGKICYQKAVPPLVNFADMSESCLSLNIYTQESPGTQAKLPVMVWIHGGGFAAGAAKDYNPTNLVQQGVVVVTLNYRLGAFGFFSPLLLQDGTPCGYYCSGMNGMGDQINALKWVQKYIAPFGGDPKNVTIFGESAGSVSVCTLIFSPSAAGLFDKAMMESGACNGGWGPAPRTLGALLSWNFARSFSASSRLNWGSVNAIEIVNKTKMLFPTVDGNILTQTIHGYISSSGTVWNGNAYLIGTNSRDGLMGFMKWASGGAGPPPATPPITSRTQFISRVECILRSFFKPPYVTSAQAVEVANMFEQTSNPNDAALWEDSAIWWNSDMCLTCPSRSFAIAAANSNRPTFIYEYYGAYEPFQAYHAAEMTQLFPLSFSLAFATLPGGKYNKTLSDMMVTAWTNFAKSGNPSDAQMSINWPDYQPQSTQIGDTIKGVRFTPVSNWRVNNVNGPNCQRLDEIFGVINNISNAQVFKLLSGGFYFPRQFLSCLSPFIEPIINIDVLCSFIDAEYAAVVSNSGGNINAPVILSGTSRNGVALDSAADFLLANNVSVPTTPAPTRSGGSKLGWKWAVCLGVAVAALMDHAW